MLSRLQSDHPDTIQCPSCGKSGRLIWDNVRGAAEKTLVRIDGDFYERFGKKKPHAVELVCNGCGKAHTSPLQS